MAISQDPAIRRVEDPALLRIEKPALAEAPPLHDPFAFTRRHRWRSGRSCFLVADGLAIAVGLAAVESVPRTGLAFGSVAFALCVTWARIGDRIAVSGLDRAARALAAIAIAKLAAELVVGSTVPASGAVFVLFCVLLARALVVRLLSALRARRVLGEPVLVLGSYEGVIVEAMHEHPELGLLPVTVSALGTDARRIVDLNDATRLDAVLRERRIRRVFVDSSVLARPVWHEIESRVQLCCVLPNPLGLPVVHRINDHVWGLPVARVWCRADARPMWRVKRPFETAIALVGIVVTAPLAIITFLAVRASGRGPTLLKQQRVGRHGSVVRVTKFRTMRPVDGPPEIDLTDAEGAAERQHRQQEDADSRVTRVGRVLRATSIDELPQLLDVVRGDLSLTGPRPELPVQAVHYARSVDGYPARHRVRSGLSGWAQVHGLRGDTSLSDRARFDNYYIDTWSFGRDLKIVLWTGVEIIRHGAQAALRRGGS
jgi:lipopolysaccharide/colanic/teichoic acid biosynthesis glycosyltransferase